MRVRNRAKARHSAVPAIVWIEETVMLAAAHLLAALPFRYSNALKTEWKDST
jgi:hypothetical protein